MPICTSCGTENREEARFCDSCGTPLVAPTPAREQRKMVTVLFCDVVGSTALGERLDPESLCRVMSRYFDAMREIIERHGGTVEKFIGDAVMAVFGVPVLHEDDALRALRAASAMREALVSLNEGLARDHGTTLELRTGVNTGEVVTGTKERLATGDAVNVAARLEQAAGPGEVLLGPETLRLTRGWVEVEPVAVLPLKGKSEAVPAYRLLGVCVDTPAPGPHASMVGRERERRLLGDVWERVVSERSCQLFTVLGVAGVGKSRLAAEFVAPLDGATLVRGRCLSYGEGITYWPVLEVVHQLCGADAAARLSELGLDSVAAEAIEGLLGGETSPSSSEAIAWAVRQLLEAASLERPLIVLLDDLQWGEPTFLDLVEHVADLSRGAALLLLCLARPELHDRRASWGGGKLNATTVLLEPLDAAETDDLIDRLVAEAGLTEALRERIKEAAEGNPLFVEEMVAMLRDSPDGEVAVPPTIEALLSARLDQLDPSERTVLERGAVEGRVFHRGAVQALAPEQDQLTDRLVALVRKELVRPDQPHFQGEQAYRFRHLLMREAAYDGLPKAARAVLHERFAGWLEARATELVEREQIVGYHLEQAYRYRVELGPIDDRSRELADEAGQLLGSAGRRAMAHGDMAAAASLLGRATSLLPAGSSMRLELLPELGTALRSIIDFAGAEATFIEAIEEAVAAGDRRVELYAALERASLHRLTDPEGAAEELLRLAQSAIPVFEELGDDASLARAWRGVADVHHNACRFGPKEAALERALVHAHRAGDKHQEGMILRELAYDVALGPTPAEEGLGRCEAILAGTDNPLMRANCLAAKGRLDAMRGGFDEARAAVELARGIVTELRGRLGGVFMAESLWEVEMLAGDFAAAEREIRAAYESLQDLGEKGLLSSYACLLAQALYSQGRYEEAERLTEIGEEVAASDDVATQVLYRQVRAKLLARRGELEHAQALAQEAAEIAATTDLLPWRGNVLLDLAEVLGLAGRPNDAVVGLEEAIALYKQKGDIVSLGKARALLEELRTASAS